VSALANGKRWNWSPKVPEISERRILELAERIKPVVTFEEEGRCYIKPVDMFSESFTWDPEPASKAIGLKLLCDITTYHPYGYYGSFKPSVAQVILQIPAEHLDRVVAFEIVKHPETADDLDAESEIFNSGYHVATTRLYVRE
jgi:hypothetical protein